MILAYLSLPSFAAAPPERPSACHPVFHQHRAEPDDHNGPMRLLELRPAG